MPYNSKNIKTDYNGNPIPQYFNEQTDEFEDLRGSDGATHSKIVDGDGNYLSTIPVVDSDLKAELEVIKQTQVEILDRLNQPIDTQVTGSIVEYFDITEDVGTIPAGTTKAVHLNNSRYMYDFLYASVMFRRSEGGIASISLQTRTNAFSAVGMVLSDEIYKSEAVGTLGKTDKIKLTSDRFSLWFQAGNEEDFIPLGVSLFLWRR